MALPIETLEFETREDRARYTASRFGHLLRGRVLDVGCWKREVFKHKPDIEEYIGIDIAGDPTIQIDLEKTERLPFDDASFDCIICTEVLEHLDAAHRVFDEMVRVSRGAMIISLPNCWRTMRSRIIKGRGTPRFYGLPVEKPEDRHKWFFNVADVVAFFEGQCQRHPLTVEHTHVQFHPRNPVMMKLLRAMHPTQMAFLNRYADSVWTVLRKRSGSDAGS